MRGVEKTAIWNKVSLVGLMCNSMVCSFFENSGIYL
jgi:hypothetical protein